MTVEERASRCHELRMKLNALDALNENERLFEDFRRTLEEAQAALEGNAEGAEGATEDIEKAQDALDAFNELLGGTVEFLEGAKDALGEVSEGIEQFGEAAGDVAGALSEITSTIEHVADLQNLSEASAQDMINGLGEHIGGMVETLGPLIDVIPGMGAFLHMYGEAISGIAISVGKIETEVASRNQILQEAMGKDLYITPQTSRQQRSSEIEDILSQLDELDCFGAHGDGAETGSGSAYSTDYHAAVGIGLRDCNKTRTSFEHAITLLNRSRLRLKRAWDTLGRLEQRDWQIGQDLEAVRSDLATRAITPQLAEARTYGLEAQRASLPDRIESARERARRALEDYEAKLDQVDPCYRRMIAQANNLNDTAGAELIEELSQFDPNPAWLPIGAIRDAFPEEDQRTSLRPVLIGGGVFAGALLLTAAIIIPSGDPEPVSTTEAPAAAITEQIEEAIVEEIVEKIEEQIPELDLADTAFPERLSYKITKTGDPIPAPFGDIPNGVQLEGTFDLSIDCGPLGQRCTYAMGYETDTPPHPPYSVPPVAPWDHNGTTWFIETPALFLSASYPGGFECIYSASDVWELTVTNAEWDGDRWVATAFTGTLVREQHLDPELSAAAIAAEYCPPYAEATSWDVEATGRVSVP
jgi:archaellum component FlaC